MNELLKYLHQIFFIAQVYLQWSLWRIEHLNNSKIRTQKYIFENIQLNMAFIRIKNKRIKSEIFWGKETNQWRIVRSSRWDVAESAEVANKSWRRCQRVEGSDDVVVASRSPEKASPSTSDLFFSFFFFLPVGKSEEMRSCWIRGFYLGPFGFWVW